MIELLLFIDSLLLVLIVVLLHQSLSLMRRSGADSLSKTHRASLGHVEIMANSASHGSPYVGKDHANDFMTGKPKKHCRYVQVAR